MKEKSGLVISEEFIRELLWPLLQRELPEVCGRLAIAIVGTGSDVLGLDDQVSKDHHWGPRANVILLPEDVPQLAQRVQEAFTKLPEKFRTFSISTQFENMTGVCCSGMNDFFTFFLGTATLPASDRDWLNLCETDLLHVTAGKVIIDGPGELTYRRNALAYYPETVWKKRIADWCMYITGRDAPYNLNRMSKRNDRMAALMYESMYYKQVMELCFTLNRQYAPYTKWLNRTYRTLGHYVDKISPALDAILPEKDLHQKVLKMIEVNYLIADALTDLALTPKAKRREFDPGLTDLTLYDAAFQIYRTLPAELLPVSFNRTESWEHMAREVLFCSHDYFQEKIKS